MSLYFMFYKTLTWCILLQRKRKILEEKIANLNAAIDDASAHFRSEDGPNGVAVNSGEIESAIWENTVVLRFGSMGIRRV